MNKLFNTSACRKRVAWVRGGEFSRKMQNKYKVLIYLCPCECVKDNKWKIWKLMVGGSDRQLTLYECGNLTSQRHCIVFRFGFMKLEHGTFKSEILNHKEQKVSLHIPLRMLPGSWSRETWVKNSCSPFACRFFFGGNLWMWLLDISFYHTAFMCNYSSQALEQLRVKLSASSPVHLQRKMQQIGKHIQARPKRKFKFKIWFRERQKSPAPHVTVSCPSGSHISVAA